MVAVRTHRTPSFDELGTPLPASFFARPSTDVARDLLGKTIVSRVDDVVTAGRIVETEAYLGSDDPGSHAATHGITRRNRVMYGPPGVAYVYFTYGMHHMLNLVTEPEGTAGAVLIRAIEPTTGRAEMVVRRKGRDGRDLADGPGKVAAALGLVLSDNQTVLGVGRIAVLEAPAPSEKVQASGRIGLARGHELPLRFYLEGAAHSRGRIGPAKRPSASGKA
jgi:DNA-3-methyladenine glycosylase